MATDVLCLRPENDFLRIGVIPPAGLSIAYRKPDDADVPALLAQARALVIPAVGPKLPAAPFEAAKRLELVQVTGAGVDRLDEAALRRLGIPVCNVPGGSNAAVGEYCVATALVMLRQLAWGDADIRAGRYAEGRARQVAANLGGLGAITVGIVGTGVIGTAVAQAFHRMGSRIVWHDPAPRDTTALAALDARGLPLDDLLSGADVVSLHVPLLPATRNLIGAPQIARMKPDAVLVNASRGGIVDEAALADALAAGRIAGAAIDVYDSEPPAPDGPLFRLAGDAARRVFFTPHIAGVTRQASVTLFGNAWANVEAVLRSGAAPAHRVY